MSWENVDASSVVVADFVGVVVVDILEVVVVVDVFGTVDMVGDGTAGGVAFVVVNCVVVSVGYVGFVCFHVFFVDDDGVVVVVVVDIADFDDDHNEDEFLASRDMYQTEEPDATPLVNPAECLHISPQERL